MGNMFARLETGVVGDPTSDIFPLLAVSTNCDESQCWGTRVSEGAVGKVGREHRRDLVQRCHTLAPSEALSLHLKLAFFHRSMFGIMLVWNLGVLNHILAASSKCCAEARSSQTVATDTNATQKKNKEKESMRRWFEGELISIPGTSES